MVEQSMSTAGTVPPVPFSDRDLEQRKRLVGFEEEDFVRIRGCGETILPHIDELVDTFFSFLTNFEGSKVLLSHRETLDEAKRLKAEHLRAMVSGNYEHHYLDKVIRLAATFGNAGLAPQLYLGASHQLMRAIDLLVKGQVKDHEEAIATFLSLKKLAFFDMSIVVDVLIGMREQMIARQREAIMELSTPILQLRDRLLILPIIGVLDSVRAKQITNTLLLAIRDNRAKVVVVDITGVAAVDSKVANHLILTVAAARLMGARVVVTGLSSDVAQALVALGVDLSSLNTVGDLQGGIEEAERVLLNHPQAGNALDSR
jgi:rsbT co-antagonist protein RsbR